MSKPLSYEYTGTKGHITDIANTIPQNGQGLIDRGWEEISHPKTQQRYQTMFRQIQNPILDLSQKGFQNINIKAKKYFTHLPPLQFRATLWSKSNKGGILLAITKNSKPLGKYGRMRKAYLMEHQKGLYCRMQQKRCASGITALRRL